MTGGRCVAAVGLMLIGGCGERPSSLRQLELCVERIARERDTRPDRREAKVTEAEPGRRGAWFDLRTTEGSTFCGADQADWDTFTLDVVPGLEEEAPASVAWTDGRLRAGPLPGFWETVKRDLETMPADLWEDTKAVYTSAPNLLILGLTYGGSLALQKTGPDDTIEDSLRDHRIFSDDFGEAFGALGNPATHFGLAGLWYLVGQQRQDDETYEVGRTLFSALIINGLSTMAGKFATWDKTPNGEYFAFPSGHTSSTFTVASVMHEAYGPWVGVPLYGLGVLVAAERLDNGEHYLADVIMGGVMGLVIGHTVAGEHELELFGGRIVPYADPQARVTGIAWHKEF